MWLDCKFLQYSQDNASDSSAPCGSRWNQVSCIIISSSSSLNFFFRLKSVQRASAHIEDSVHLRKANEMPKDYLTEYEPLLTKGSKKPKRLQVSRL